MIPGVPRSMLAVAAVNRRNLFILALALVLGLGLLARWMTQPRAVVARPHAMALASAETPAEPPSIAPSHVAMAGENATPRKVVRPSAPRHAVRGRVYDERSGGGIGTATILFRDANVARYEGNWRSRPQTHAANDGSFTMDAVPAGRITLQVYAEGYESREVDIVVTDDTPPIDIAMSTGGSISGRLVAADGVTPVVGQIGLYDLDVGAGGLSRTGDNGEFSFAHLGAARYELIGQSAEGSVSKEILLTRNQRIEDLVLILATGKSIRGVVSGLRAEDLQKLRISVRRRGEFWGGGRDVGVDERGAYVLRGVRPGRVDVVADVSMQRQLTKQIDMPADSDVTVNLEFPPGSRLSGRITHAGKPVAQAWVSPHPAAEHPVHAYGARTTIDGRYVLEGLADGDYYLFIENYQTRVSVSGDTVFDIDVPLAQLTGRVLEEGGKVPIAGADVEVWPAETATARFRQRNRSDDSGRFALSGLEPGEFILTAYKPGYEMVRQRMAYDAPIANLTVRLRQDTGVELEVRDSANGRALSHVYLIEMICNRNGSRLMLPLSAEGIGYLPSALAGSTLMFSASGYAPTRITRWNGRKLDMKLERITAQ
jgi:carboxypeptidase family protein